MRTRRDQCWSSRCLPGGLHHGEPASSCILVGRRLIGTHLRSRLCGFVVALTRARPAEDSAIDLQLAAEAHALAACGTDRTRSAIARQILRPDVHANPLMIE